MLNQTKTEYGEIINSTELTSTIICQPLTDEELRCYLNDIMVVTSNYTNFNDRITTSNLIEVGQWFHMKFNDYGIMSTNTELDAGEMANKYLIVYDIINQFNMGIDRSVQGLHWGSTATESTSIGFCTTAYKINMSYWKEDAKQETSSNFQIKLFKNFSNQTDIVLKDLHIVKNRKDCNYSRIFNDYLNGGKVTKYVHIIEVVDNKLRMVTTLDGQRLDPRNSLETSTFTQITQLNLINIRSTKTMTPIDNPSKEFENSFFERKHFM
ncbi:hypothetical protein ALC56_04457 [Trachymyrmex septentrionalis]|nr:hypothetical protein ALC56_04457 [Trachymyrmex septentrionalis]